MSRARQGHVSNTTLSSTRAKNKPSSIAQTIGFRADNEINSTGKYRIHTTMQKKSPTNHSTVSLIPNIPTQDNLSRTNATPKCRAAKRKFRKLVAQGVPQEEASKLSLMSWQAIFEMVPALQPEALQKQPEEPQIPANTIQKHTNEDENMRNCLSKKDDQVESSNNTEVTKQQFSFNNTPFRIGIRNSEPMDGTEMRMIHRHLILSIMEQFTDGSGPEFLSFTHKSGWILVTCVNKDSSDWLAQELQYLEPWPGAKISVIPEHELPSPPKVVALIPASEASSIQEALDLIRVQNQGLNTEHWQVLHERVEKSKNRTVTFIIDEPSLETLKAQNCEVALGFQIVTFRIKYSGSQSIRLPAKHNQDPQQSSSGGEENAALHLKQAKDLPRPVKMAWQTKILAGVDIQLLFSVMQKYNPGVRMEEWKILDTVPMKAGSRRIVLMDRVSAEVIKESGYQLHTGIDLSFFKLLGDADA